MSTHDLPEISRPVRHEAGAGGEYLLARSAIPEFTWACVRKAAPCGWRQL